MKQILFYSLFCCAIHSSYSYAADNNNEGELLLGGINEIREPNPSIVRFKRILRKNGTVLLLGVIIGATIVYFTPHSDDLSVLPNSPSIQDYVLLISEKTCKTSGYIWTRVCKDYQIGMLQETAENIVQLCKNICFTSLDFVNFGE